MVGLVNDIAWISKGKKELDVMAVRLDTKSRQRCLGKGFEVWMSW